MRALKESIRGTSKTSLCRLFTTATLVVTTLAVSGKQESPGPLTALDVVVGSDLTIVFVLGVGSGYR